MMSSGVGFEKMDGNGDANSGQLLMDIKAISKALYLPRISSEILISQSSSHRSKSAGKTRNSLSNSKNIVLDKEKKSSIWNWKKPLKALTHIRNRKFNCTFYLHVHTVEGMPLNFDGSSLCVHWRRKDNVFRTPPSKVSHGVAEFEETLIHKCTVYGQRNGPRHFAKYEERLFLLYVSVVGASGLDVGKHWVDLTRLLPPTLEELENDKNSGKWTTTFKLSGRARGATLNVSFGYSLMGGISAQLNDVHHAQMFTSTMKNVPSVSSEVAKLNPGGRHQIFSHTGIEPNNTRPSFRRHSESMGISGPRQVRDQKLELSRSVKYLYQKFDEVKVDESKELDCHSEDVQGSEVKHRVSLASSDEQLFAENDEIDFTVIDQGIETSVNVRLKSVDNSGTAIDSLAAQENHFVEIEQDYSDTKSHCDTDENMHYNKEFVEPDNFKIDEIKAESGGHEYEETGSQRDPPVFSDSFDFGNSNASDIFSSMKNRKELGSSSKSHRLVRSFSLDDLAEAVADEFLSMLGPDSSPYAPSSDSEPGSPRERLLRQFEMESVASGNYVFNNDAYEFETEAGCSNHDFVEDFRLTICRDPEKNMSRIPSLLSRRKAKAVEELETEDLMKKWGLSETTFVYSPHRKSGGFGSPIYCSDEETPDLPSLGDGFGPIILTHGGGFLRSISPSIFRAAKNNSGLIMQVTSQKVLPMELGTGFLEILQHLASLGVKEFSAQTCKLLPLENITGKTTQQVAWEAALVNEPDRLARMASQKNGSGSAFNQELNDSSEYTSLDELAPLAMDNIEALLIEGLRIQSNMPSEEAPSSMPPCASGKVTCPDELLSLSLPLDEWFRLDAGMSDDDMRLDHDSRLLAAHHVRCEDLGKAFGDQRCLLGNDFMIALRVQLRDPFRHFEPVGGPMLILIHVNRVYMSLEPKTNLFVLGTNAESVGIESKPSTASTTNGESEYKYNVSSTDFKIIEVHVAGINSEAQKKSLWASTSQQQYGSRWLMSSGMNKPSKTNRTRNSSKQMVRFSPPALNRTSPNDKLWSVSYSAPETATNLNHFCPSNSFVRNPDIIFSN